MECQNPSISLSYQDKKNGVPKDNDQQERKKRANSDLKKHKKQNTKYCATRIPQKLGVNSGAPEWQDIPAPLVASIVVLLLHTRYKS